MTNLSKSHKKLIIHQFLQSPLVPLPTLSNRISTSTNLDQNIILDYLMNVTESKLFGRVLKRDVLSGLEKEKDEFSDTNRNNYSLYQNNSQNNNTKEYNTKNFRKEQYSEKNQLKKSSYVNNSSKLETARRITNLEKFIKKRVNGDSSTAETSSYRTKQEQIENARMEYLQPKPLYSTENPFEKNQKTDYNKTDYNKEFGTQISEKDCPRPQLTRKERIIELLSNSTVFRLDGVPDDILTDYLVVYDFYCKYRKEMEITKLIRKSSESSIIQNGETEKEDSQSKETKIDDRNLNDFISNITPLYSNPDHLSNTHLSLHLFSIFLHSDYFSLFKSIFCHVQTERKREKVTIFMDSVARAVDMYWEGECDEISSENESDKNENEKKFDENKNNTLLETIERINWSSSKPTYTALLSFFVDMRRMLHFNIPKSIDLTSIVKEKKKRIIEESSENEEIKNSQNKEKDHKKNPSPKPTVMASEKKNSNNLLVSKIKLLKFLIDILYETNIIHKMVTDWNKDLEIDQQRLREYIKEVRSEIRRVRTAQILETQKTSQNENNNSIQAQTNLSTVSNLSNSKDLNDSKDPNNLKDLNNLEDKTNEKEQSNLNEQADLIDKTISDNATIVNPISSKISLNIVSKQKSTKENMEEKQNNDFISLPKIPRDLQTGDSKYNFLIINLEMLLTAALNYQYKLNMLLKSTSLSAEILQFDKFVFLYIDKFILFYKIKEERIYKIVSEENIKRLVSIGGEVGDGLRYCVSQSL